VVHRVRAYIGLGANVGDAERTLAAAVHALAALPGAHVAGVSRLYATAPVGVLDQPEFRNAVVALDVPAGPDPATGATVLLVALKSIERAFGRQVRGRWGPRELDLDVIVFGRARLSIERPVEGRSLDASTDPAKAAKLLEVPHPLARDRLFVLAPLADVAPGLVPPGWGQTVAGARRRRLAVEGPTAAQPVASWDRSSGDWVRDLEFSVERPLAPGRYRHPGFAPALTFAVGDGWYAVQDVPGFFDVERAPGTPDAIALQFARPVGSAGLDDAIASIRARSGLAVGAPSPRRVGGSDGLSVVVDAADPDIESRRFVPVLDVRPGPISIASGRRLEVLLAVVDGDFLAVLIGGSVRHWDSAREAAMPVVDSIRFENPL
jgi:2-amino-4-hydroxy-6-hydroxymethyldihydropteridine diphosphokinase